MNNVLNGINKSKPGNLPELNVSVKDLETVTCKNCGGNIFSQGIMIKSVSSLLTGTGQEGILPIPVYYCVKCQSVVERYLPEEMRETKPVIK